ncbi:MAG: hypothetical protein ACRDYY_17575, partial [Acidimicrobiales bacterium]
ARRVRADARQELDRLRHELDEELARTRRESEEEQRRRHSEVEAEIGARHDRARQEMQGALDQFRSEALARIRAALGGLDAEQRRLATALEDAAAWVRERFPADEGADCEGAARPD